MLSSVTSRAAGCSFSFSTWRVAKGEIRSRTCNTCAVKLTFTIRNFRSDRGRWWQTKWICRRQPRTWPLFADDFRGREVLPVSARENQGIDELKPHLDRWLREADGEMKRSKDIRLQNSYRFDRGRIQLDKRNRCVKSSKLFFGGPEGPPTLLCRNWSSQVTAPPS